MSELSEAVATVRAWVEEAGQDVSADVQSGTETVEQLRGMREKVGEILAAVNSTREGILELAGMMKNASIRDTDNVLNVSRHSERIGQLLAAVYDVTEESANSDAESARVNQNKASRAAQESWEERKGAQDLLESTLVWPEHIEGAIGTASIYLFGLDIRLGRIQSTTLAGIGKSEEAAGSSAAAAEALERYESTIA